jgi:hypothetical protein
LRVAYYTVVWTNTAFKMLYVNMGDNDTDHKREVDNTNSNLSFTFASDTQNKMIVATLMCLGLRKM